MAYGPLEYFIIGFEGHRFSGEIAPALRKAADSGAIRIDDLVFITKDRSGAVRKLEYEDFDNQTAEAFAALLDRTAEGFFSSQDLDEIGAGIENDSSVALVLVEHLWAKDIRDAIVNANGRLLHDDFVTQDTVAELERTTA